jgi:hypothetical protein
MVIPDTVNYVFDIVLHLRISLHQRANHDGRQIVGARMAQCTARSLAHRRSQTVDY